MPQHSITRDGSRATPEPPGAGGHRRTKTERLVHELTKFSLMFLYLWLQFGLFVLHENIIRAQTGLDYQMQGFAIINALVLAKVMLIAEDLKLDQWLRGRPLVYAILGESFLFTIVLIAFHVLEKIVVGLVGGSSLAHSVPAIGGGGFAGVMIVGATFFVTLIPYFAFRDIGNVLGWAEMRALLFTGQPTAGVAGVASH
jgi:hypothetical protein